MTFVSKILAALMLVAMFGLAFASSWNDAATFDESSHIGAGYSYITQRDMRLNPEHPPILKDLAGLSLSIIHPVYRTNTPAWQTGINEQWVQGAGFLYEWGNNPDRILHYARFPTMILAVITGSLFFLWVARNFGNNIALLATFLYAFSPTVIAHSRLVTTDIAAAFGFLIGIASFLLFLKEPTLKRVIIAGVAFGIAELLKFSLFLLVPIDILLAFFWLFSRSEKKRIYFEIALKVAAIFIIGALIVWLVYAYHVWNYPQEKQLQDAKTLVGNFGVKPITKLDLWLINNKFTRPLGHYLMGVMMVSQRTAGGNSAYFMGEVSSKGWRQYFPTVYATKETLALHILTIVALALAISRVARAKEKSFAHFRAWIHDNFAYFTSAFFVFFYWAYSMANPLNIGVRHVLPTFPFIYLLVSKQLVEWRPGHIKKEVGRLALFVMLFWIVWSVVSAYPYFLSYYNELAGNSQLGYNIATDSNYDWGQDLKRLRDYIRANHPTEEKIYLDYFGGGSPRYYLGEQYESWGSSRGAPPHGSLFVVSANSLIGSKARPVKGFPEPKPEDTYQWLGSLKPIARGGMSIFIYRIP